MAEKLVRMSNGEVEHEFVTESVPVWEDRGWQRVEDSTTEEGDQAQLVETKDGQVVEQPKPTAQTKEQKQLAADQAPQTSK